MSDEIQKLVDGFGRFRSEHYESDDSLYQRLTRDGQSPRVMVIACCDSRVDPAIISDCNPGDLFVVRNVASLVPPYETGGHYHGTSAALEFAVRYLHVQNVVMLGHSRCGGIRVLITGIQGADGLGQFIAPWMAAGAPHGTGPVATLQSLHFPIRKTRISQRPGNARHAQTNPKTIAWNLHRYPLPFIRTSLIRWP